MTTIQREIVLMEKCLRLAQLDPDPAFLDEVLANDAVLISPESEPAFGKAKVVAAHQPGTCPKFTRVEIADMTIVDHGSTAVVTCRGTYESPQFSGTLKFMRVWVKKDDGWQIVAVSVSN